MPLDPQLLAQLQQQYQQQGMGASMNVGGTLYSPMGIVHAGEDAGAPSQLQGFGAFDPNHMQPGDSYQYFDPSGGSAGTRKVESNSIGSFLGDTVKDLAPVAAMIAAGYGVGSLLNGGFLGLGGGGLDPSLAVQGSSINALDAATGVPYGSSAAAGIPNTASMGASGAGFGSGGAGGAGGATDIFGGNGMATGFTDTGTAGGALDAGYAGSGALTGASGLASAANGGGLNSLLSGLPSGIGSYIAPLIGGLLGSQGVHSQQTATRDVPEWLKPYIGRELGYANSLLDHQMSPEYQQASDQVRTGALGMLAPQQQSNFARFFPNAGMGQMNTNRPLGLLSY